ncbi:MAG: YgjV family protein [Eubacterium sp.]|nr:YgjV family protein [Eubacterium sp.]
MILKIITQIIGFVGFFLAVATFQSNKHKNITLIKCASDAMFVIQFILLGAYTGAIMNGIGCVRNIVYAQLVEKKKSVVTAVVIFSLIILLGGVVTWSGPISLLAIVGKLLSTLSYAFKKPKTVRLMTIPVCLVWGVYDAISGSPAGVLTEVFTLASIATAYFRFDCKKEDNTVNG